MTESISEERQVYIAKLQCKLQTQGNTLDGLKDEEIVGPVKEEKTENFGTETQMYLNNLHDDPSTTGKRNCSVKRKIADV